MSLDNHNIENQAACDAPRQFGFDCCGNQRVADARMDDCMSVKPTVDNTVHEGVVLCVHTSGCVVRENVLDVTGENSTSHDSEACNPCVYDVCEDQLAKVCVTAHNFAFTGSLRDRQRLCGLGVVPAWCAYNYSEEIIYDDGVVHMRCEYASHDNDLRIIRRVYSDHIYNCLFVLPANLRGGVGRALIANEIAFAKRFGQTELRCHAANGDYIGYLVWPALGFDAEVSVPSDVNDRNSERVDVSVLDFIEQNGLHVWKRVGHDISCAIFDVRDGSRSRQVFDAKMLEADYAYYIDNYCEVTFVEDVLPANTAYANIGPCFVDVVIAPCAESLQRRYDWRLQRYIVIPQIGHRESVPFNGRIVVENGLNLSTSEFIDRYGVVAYRRWWRNFVAQQYAKVRAKVSQ